MRRKDIEVLAATSPAGSDMTTTIAPPEQSAASVGDDAGEPTRRRSRWKRRRLLVALAAVLAALAAAGLGARAVLGGVETVEGGRGEDTFEVVVPDGWRALSGDELAAQPGRPEAVIRREDGTGFFVVRRAGKAAASLDSFAKDLDEEFAKRIPDFERRSTRKLKIKAGDAFFYSYIRKRAGTVHSVVLVPGPNGSYIINTVAKGGHDQAARQLGGMIVNFGR